jgi:hypothetical protein
VPEEATIPLEDPAQGDDFSVSTLQLYISYFICFLLFCFGYLTILQEIA